MAGSSQRPRSHPDVEPTRGTTACRGYSQGSNRARTTTRYRSPVPFHRYSSRPAIASLPCPSSSGRTEPIADASAASSSPQPSSREWPTHWPSSGYPPSSWSNPKGDPTRKQSIDDCHNRLPGCCYTSCCHPARTSPQRPRYCCCYYSPSDANSSKTASCPTSHSPPSYRYCSDADGADYYYSSTAHNLSVPTPTLSVARSARC